jgi:hypothetical protein
MQEQARLQTIQSILIKCLNEVTFSFTYRNVSHGQEQEHHTLEDLWVQHEGNFQEDQSTVGKMENFTDICCLMIISYTLMLSYRAFGKTRTKLRSFEAITTLKEKMHCDLIFS